MGSFLIDNALKICVSVFLLIVCLFPPTLIWSAGFQEQKLFDKDFYSSEELRHKVENHNKELNMVDHQIKRLESDVDWLVLKINQIQDSGRSVSLKLKDAVTKKEKKIDALHKNKNRLEALVQYYSAALSKKKDKDRVAEYIPPKQSTILKRPDGIENSSKADVKKEPIHDNRINKSEIQSAINNSGLGDWVEIVGTDSRLRMETTLPILFPSGSATVAGEYKSFLKKLAGFLKPYDVKVLVNGYADAVPIKNKTYPSNFELGAKRAANIVHQLVHFGLNPAIFKIESSGKYRSAAKGMSKQKTFERRAEVTVVFSG